jgi:hypothetical protein
MREVTDHRLNPANDAITIEVLDEPGAGGANHTYRVTGGGVCHHINFQNGPIGEAGVNGLTNEVLLAIVIDRLRSFQAGPFKCEHNKFALSRIEEGLHWLQERTRERQARGVEGKSEL